MSTPTFPGSAPGDTGHASANEPGPVPKGSYCPECGLAFQVKGCTKDGCKKPTPDDDTAAKVAALFDALASSERATRVLRGERNP